MPFKKGQSGNPKGKAKGTKDSVARVTFRSIVREVLYEQRDTIKLALEKGLQGDRAEKYLAIMASLERQMVEVTGADGGPIVYRWQD